ncbi:COG3, partial [Symbiodinium necroappetens]
SQKVASKDAEASDDTAFEAFHGHWHSVRLRQRTQEGSRRRGRWRWIYRVQQICDSACGELDAVLDQLTELDRQRCDVLRKTTALHEQCEQMVQDQDRLAKEAEALAEALDYFDRVADVACVLDHHSANGFLSNAGTAVASAASESPDTEFGSVLDKIDGSISFLEAHPDFCQASAYMSQFEHLRNRACLAMRSSLQKSLERSAAHVEQQLKDAQAVPNQAPEFPNSP